MYENYSEQVKKLLEKNKFFNNIVSLLRDLSEKKCLIYSHDDPDGITSAVILARYLGKKNCTYDLKIPRHFKMDENELVSDTKDKNYDILFILDKGTFDYYDRFKNYVPVVVVIDHHLPDPVILNRFCFNPSFKGNVNCSTSLLMNQILSAISPLSDLDNFYTLVGLKGDFAIECITKKITNFSYPFYLLVKKKFEKFIVAIEERLTMFDVYQRKKTNLLNQITELIHGISGGGHQYFYTDKEEELKDINQPELTFKVLRSAKNDILDLTNSVEDFIANLPQTRIIKKLYKYFLNDWEKAIPALEFITPIGSIDETTIYLFIGNKVPLMPIIGVVKLHQAIKENKDKQAIIIMINKEASGIHISFRATSPHIHCGKLCKNLALYFSSQYGYSKFISGGGHSMAAKCFIHINEIPLTLIIADLTNFIRKLHSYSIRLSNKKITKIEYDNAIEIGFEYIDKNRKYFHDYNQLFINFEREDDNE
jgi:hypothetical protein